MKMKNLVKFVASVGFIGYCPVASGTVVSAIFLFLIYQFVFSLLLFIISGLIIIALGFWSSGKAAFILNQRDPSKVVIDEVAGLFVALFLIPQSIGAYAIAFILFRILDIIKPPPLRQIEQIRGSVGIMCDDLLAGLFANILTQLILKLIL